MNLFGIRAEGGDVSTTATLKNRTEDDINHWVCCYFSLLRAAFIRSCYYHQRCVLLLLSAPGCYYHRRCVLLLLLPPRRCSPLLLPPRCVLLLLLPPRTRGCSSSSMPLLLLPPRSKVCAAAAASTTKKMYVAATTAKVCAAAAAATTGGTLLLPPPAGSPHPLPSRLLPIGDPAGCAKSKKGFGVRFHSRLRGAPGSWSSFNRKR